MSVPIVHKLFEASHCVYSCGGVVTERACAGTAMFLSSLSCVISLSVVRDFHLRRIDRRFLLVRRVVADPQQPVVPDQAGVTSVAAAGECDGFRERALFRVEPAERCALSAVVEADHSHETTVRQLNHVRPADSRAELIWSGSFGSPHSLRVMPRRLQLGENQRNDHDGQESPPRGLTNQPGPEWSVTLGPLVTARRAGIEWPRGLHAHQCISHVARYPPQRFSPISVRLESLTYVLRR